jgi:hypothetical protein
MKHYISRKNQFILSKKIEIKFYCCFVSIQTKQHGKSTPQ